MPFGITPAGFARKDLATILAEIEEQQRDDIDPGLNQEGDSLLGQLNSVVGNAFAELWEVAEAIYDNQYPDTASNQSLDDVAAITGTSRRAATNSTVLCDVNIDGGFTLPAGSVAFVPGQAGTTRFLLDEDLNNPGGGPATFIGVAFTAQDTGPVVANAGTLTGGPELVTGWNSVTNPNDATLGKLQETDAELRLRRLQEVAGAGGSTLEAIRADVSRVAGVISVKALENTSDIVDSNGLPPHSFEVLVLGGDDDDIAQAIFDTKPAGILAFGSTIVNVEDSEGVTVPIGFSRPTAKQVWLELDLLVDDDYPAGGDDAVKQTVVEFAETIFLTGDDVVLARLNQAAFMVMGVRDITEIRAGFAVSPIGTANLIIALRELASFDTSRVVVNTSPFVDL